MHKGTEVGHCCFVGQEQRVCGTPGTVLRRGNFHWGNLLKQGASLRESQRLLSLLRKPVFAAVGTWTVAEGRRAAAYLHPKQRCSTEKPLNRKQSPWGESRGEADSRLLEKGQDNFDLCTYKKLVTVCSLSLFSVFEKCAQTGCVWNNVFLKK